MYRCRNRFVLRRNNKPYIANPSYPKVDLWLDKNSQYCITVPYFEPIGNVNVIVRPYSTCSNRPQVACPCRAAVDTAVVSLFCDVKASHVSSGKPFH